MRHQVLTALLLAAGAANASNRSGFGLDVLVSGDPRPEFAARGTTYVEALKGRDYPLRLSNPTGSASPSRCPWTASTRSTRSTRPRRTRASGSLRRTKRSSSPAGR